MTTNYSYRVWTESGQMVAYITDPLHDPPQYAENLEGGEKQHAIEIVNVDKAEAGNENFYQSTINEAARLYIRTSKETGNSWEVKFDQDWEEVPWPGTPPLPKAKFEEELTNAKVTVRVIGTRVIVMITGDI